MASNKHFRTDSPLPGRKPLKNNHYFDLITFSTWDNVLGPRIIRQWCKESTSVDEAGFLRDPEDLRSIATYSIDVAEETVTDADNISEKFFVLGETSIMLSTFLIRIDNGHNDIKVFALSFILPTSELDEWLSRRTFMENSCKRIIHKNLMINLKEEIYQGNPESSEYCAVLDKFESECGWDNLQTFALLANQSRFHSLVNQPSSTTYISSYLLHKEGNVDFLKRVITSHLVSHGHTLVVGTDEREVNKMIKTLASFSPPKECKMSLMCSHDEHIPYCADLYLQGMLIELESSKVLKLPLALKDFCQSAISANVVPPTVVYMDEEKVFHFSSILDYYRFVSANSPDSTEPGLNQPVNLSEKIFSEVSLSAPMINHLFMELKGLVPVYKVDSEFCDQYINHFMHLLQRKSLVMAKVIEQNSKYLAAAENIESEGLQTLLKQALGTKDEHDVKIVEGALGRLDPGFLRKYLPIAAGVEKRRAIVMKEIGVL